MVFAAAMLPKIGRPRDGCGCCDAAVRQSLFYRMLPRMEKLLWVFTPVFLATLFVAWRHWRGRALSRQGLHVGFSLLLLFYALGTMGLGIFWVANQQLPVFDWHYLFGYATVLLLAVHMAFNLGTVWRYLQTRLRGGHPGATGAAASARAAAPMGGRRPLLGAMGLGGIAVATGLGYVVGLRHGRTELHIAAAAGPGTAGAAANLAAAPAQAWAVVERFHAVSGHSRSGVFRRAASADWGLAPPPFKAYPNAPTVRLPPLRATALAAEAAPQAPDLATVGSWLWHTAGISERRGGIAFRTGPSSGALFATELYLLALQVQGLATGLWHYGPKDHQLHRLHRDEPADRAATQAVLAALAPGALPPGCTAVIVATAIFARSGHKYGDRTYRYVTADLGHALENLTVVARTTGVHTCRLLPLFDDQVIGEALALELRREAVLAVAALAPAPAPGASAVSTPTQVATGWQMALGPALMTSALPDMTGAGPTPLGLTHAMQLATSLRAGTATGTGHGGGLATAAPTTQPTTPPKVPAAANHALPDARSLHADWRGVIARRRSVRRFSSVPISQQALADILAAMTSAPAVLSTAVRVDVLTAAVEDLEPASWRHDAAARSLQRRVVHGEAQRRRQRAAALDQDVIGDAAVVFVLSLDRATLLAEPLGPARAWRHGFIEAGLVGERLYLAAGALGLGVCGVGAFYDDEASALVGVDAAREWVVHFAALGVPA